MVSMLDLNETYHLEFTQHNDNLPLPVSIKENLMVFYSWLKKKTTKYCFINATVEPTSHATTGKNLGINSKKLVPSADSLIKL